MEQKKYERIAWYFSHKFLRSTSALKRLEMVGNINIVREEPHL